MSGSVALLIVALGAFAWKRSLDGARRRTIVFLPHPSSFGRPKKIGERYAAEDLESLKRLLAVA